MSAEQNNAAEHYANKRAYARSEIEQAGWLPTCSIDALKARGEMLRKIRLFFAEQGVLEVETPILSAAVATDPYLDAIQCSVAGVQSRLWTDSRVFDAEHAQDPLFFMQTSPEFAMKRLLAAGSGPIYQICKTFRNGERGRRHNPEFTMLEWYRPGFNDLNLMTEVEALVQLALPHFSLPFERITYRDAFRQYAGIDPFLASVAELKSCILSFTEMPGLSDDRDLLLDVILSHKVEPRLGAERPSFLHDYPASQAALAQVTQVDGYDVAQRFELYIHGLEIANGYHELLDAREQEQRLQADNRARMTLDKPCRPIDYHLIDALSAGMPACAGVALGLDRLLMIALGAEEIDAVLTFPVDRA
ncbi:elongation factor P Lys34 lysyltransferase [Oleiphilus messinensis]|uniref:Elongation factor P Lys34 lysyltransferase n=1 Tax=Oleiphilus messinensis TaxID=141451 RepID=A0A1Y0I6N2_9GAMM|nr:EF-P lysine aminoacylase EpmA [Oleiphilus messinensis]ARU55890.1 elongation factor P Lys34 lysyltransferase [Oleiphilus messinensis]